MIEQKKSYINWKRVLFIVLLFSILSLIIYVFMFYRNIIESKTVGFDEAERFVLQNTNMKLVNHIYYFQEAEGYFILHSVDDDGNGHLVFLKDNDIFSTNELYIVAETELLSADSLENELRSQCTNCKIVSSQPAMIDQVPLWELAYYDESNRYVIEYKYLKNGQTYEKITLTTN